MKIGPMMCTRTSEPRPNQRSARPRTVRGPRPDRGEHRDVSRSRRRDQTEATSLTPDLQNILRFIYFFLFYNNGTSLLSAPWLSRTLVTRLRIRLSGGSSSHTQSSQIRRFREDAHLPAGCRRKLRHDERVSIRLLAMVSM